MSRSINNYSIEDALDIVINGDDSDFESSDDEELEFENTIFEQDDDDAAESSSKDEDDEKCKVSSKISLRKILSRNSFIPKIKYKR